MKISAHLVEPGIVSTAELLKKVPDFEWIRIAERFGDILRVRKGWYAHPAEQDDVIKAWRIGGRLTCISALAHHGLAEPPDTLHIEVPANTPRLRSPHNHRLPLTPNDNVIIHWVRTPSEGDRRAVSPAAAHRTHQHCAHQNGERTHHTAPIESSGV